MFFSNIYLAGYAILWIFLLVSFILKNKKLETGGMLLITYTISALSAIVFYNGIGAFLNSGNDIELAPLLYLFFCLNICMFPLYRHSNQLSKLKLEVSYKGDSILLQFVRLTSPFIIEAFIEIAVIAMGTKTSSLGVLYETTNDSVGMQLTFLGRKTMAICRWFSYLWPIFFFYFWGKGKKNRKYAIIALLAFSTLILESYAGASRVGIVRNLMYFFIVFLIYKATLPVAEKKKIARLFSVGVPLLIVLLALITISRFNYGYSGDSDILTWITLYSGEAPIRFCQYLWDIKQTMEGDNTFSLFKELLGLDTITDLEQRRDYWGGRIGIPNEIFYSWIGDIYFDLGRIGTVVYVIIFSLSLEFYLKRIIRRGFLTLSSVLIMSMLLLILEFGIMYMTFKVYIIQLLLIPNFIFVISFNLLSKKTTY